MKFNDSPGEWSAFWLQSPTIGTPRGDPTTAGVEMDIAEHRVRCVNARQSPSRYVCDPADNVSDRVHQALIWDGYGDDHQSLVRFSDALAGLVDDTWHTLALSWTPTDMTFYYDDVATWSVTAPISQRSQYIILSSEIGATFAGAIPEAGYGSRATTDTKLQVDYVRVWDTVRELPTPTSTRSPVASGTARVGSPLSCSSGSWSGNPDFAYQWLSDGSEIADAATPAHVVGAADRGHGLACRVTATNAAGAATVLSNTLVIAAALQKVAPTVSATITCGPAVCAARAVRVTALGTVRIARSPRTPVVGYKARASAKTGAGGTMVTAKAALDRRLRSRIRHALVAGTPVVVKFSFRVLDSAGNTRTITYRIGLRL